MALSIAENFIHLSCFLRSSMLSLGCVSRCRSSYIIFAKLAFDAPFSRPAMISASSGRDDILLIS